MRRPSLALRIAALLLGAHTVLASGASTVVVLIAVGGSVTFSVFGPGTIQNAPQLILIYGFAAAAIAGSGGATVVGLWRGRPWATVAALAEEAVWAVVVLVGINSPAYSTLEIAILLSPAVLVGLVLAAGVRGRPLRLSDSRTLGPTLTFWTAGAGYNQELGISSATAVAPTCGGLEGVGPMSTRRDQERRIRCVP